MQINLMGPVRLVHAFLLSMKSSGGGCRRTVARCRTCRHERRADLRRHGGGSSPILENLNTCERAG
jgi:hypothetical protein